MNNNTIFGNQMYGGMMPAVQQTKPNYCNPLGDEKIKRLLSQGNGLPKIALTEEDLDRAICTHRYKGETQLVQLPSGEVQCKICGAKFEIVQDARPEDIALATKNLHDLLHTAKIMMVDAPEAMITENFQVLAVIDKVPEIYSIAEASYTKFIRSNPNMNQFGGSTMNGASLWSQIIGPASMGMGGYQQQATGSAFNMNNAQIVGYTQDGYPIYGNPATNQNMQATPNTAQAAMVAGNGTTPAYTSPAQVTVNPSTQGATVSTTLQA